MLKEFRDFITKGNVLDLAVGVIIAGAFALITASLVSDIIMPMVAAMFGGLDFSNKFIPLVDGITANTLEEAREQGPVLAWGAFLTVVINFVMIAFIIFMMVRSFNKTQKKKEEAPAEPAAPSEDIVLLSEIRDLLKKKK